jgi:hypothetical protein
VVDPGVNVGFAPVEALKLVEGFQV